MSKYRFTLPERWAVWKTHGPLCRWCNEPVSYKPSQVDHVLPENIEPTELERLKKLFGLHEDFQINSFYNWIPIHSGCNQSKSDDVFDGAPFVGQLLKRIEAKYSEAVKQYEQMKNEPKAAKLIASLQRAIEAGTITEETINEILIEADTSDNPAVGITESAKEHDLLNVPFGWVTIKDEGEQIFVTKDGKAGYIPKSKAPDVSWLCGYCYHYGPWNGNQCLTCGHFSYPD